MKVVINRCYGGFNLPSPNDTGVTLPREEDYYLVHRSDPQLVFLVENMNDDQNHWCSRLRVVEWPDNIPYAVIDYDGMEHLVLDVKSFLDKHREEFMLNESPLYNDLVELDKHNMRTTDLHEGW